MSEKKYFVHESSYIDDNVSIGEGTKIGIFAMYNPEHKSAKNVLLVRM